MHVRWNYPPCIRRRNKECLPFNTTLVLRGFIPGFSVTRRYAASLQKNPMIRVDFRNPTSLTPKQQLS